MIIKKQNSSINLIKFRILMRSKKIAKQTVAISIWSSSMILFQLDE